MVGGGIVVGFPLLTSFALTSVPASHGAVVIALLPAATANRRSSSGARASPDGVLARHVSRRRRCRRLRLRTARRLWAAALGGPDLLGAVAAAAVGYAEGGLLARELGAGRPCHGRLSLQRR